MNHEEAKKIKYAIELLSQRKLIEFQIELLENHVTKLEIDGDPLGSIPKFQYRLDFYRDRLNVNVTEEELEQNPGVPPWNNEKWPFYADIISDLGNAAFASAGKKLAGK